jgi:hypothetical protein
MRGSPQRGGRDAALRLQLEPVLVKAPATRL